MKVIEYRKPREGKKDKVWMKVLFSNQEWVIIFLAAVSVSLGFFASNGVSAKYKGDLVGAVAGAYLMLTVFFYVIWFFLSTLAIYHARKKGTIVKRTE